MHQALLPFGLGNSKGTQDPKELVERQCPVTTMISVATDVVPASYVKTQFVGAQVAVEVLALHQVEPVRGWPGQELNPPHAQHLMTIGISELDLVGN